MEKVRYAEMLPHEIVARRQRFPAAFIGLGILEWHSEHLAVGLDGLKADKLCELAAARSSGFAFPTLWYGEPRITRLMEVDHDQDRGIRTRMGFKDEKLSVSYFGNTPEMQVVFYQDLVFHILVQMNTLEMQAVCLLCGHYPLYDWVVPVVERFNAQFKDTQAFAGIEFHYPPETPEVGGDHAAKWETSYLWYLRPDCVDMSIYLGRDKESLVGIMGADPRDEASIEIGRRACNLIVGGMVRKAEELINRAKGD